MARRALMIAFHFPPQQGSSGMQRTLKFAQYLPRFGWHPLVLTAHPRAYERRDNDTLDQPGAGIPVHRAFALDTARHLAFRRRYPRLLALPDRWVSWVAGAVPAGVLILRRARPQIIWSTYPIASAHLIGWILQRLTGLPWVADMRDPMTEPGFPADRHAWRAHLWIERAVARRCARMVCTTPGALRLYQERYPELPASRFCLIENGYDEESFADAARAGEHRPPGPPARLTLVHSGIIYPAERDPLHLFDALAGLKAAGEIGPATLRIVLRASGHDSYLAPLIAARNLQDLVELAPPLPYREALAEMLAADGLLILQAANCNDQIPAKLYEYLRARRPILALTDPAGDTAAAMRRAALDTMARLDASEEIARAIMGFVAQVRAGSAPLPTLAHSRSHSRQARTQQLAALFDELLAGTTDA